MLELRENLIRQAVPSERFISAWVRGALCSALGMLWFVALTFLARRLTGALEVALSPAVLLTVVLCAALVAFGLRCARRGAISQPMFDALGTLAVLVLLAALSDFRTSPGVLGFAWLAVLTAEAWWWQSQFRALRGGVPVRKAAASRPANAVADRAREAAHPREAPVEDASELDATGVWQQITRSRDAQGIDHLMGMLQATFLPGERTAVLHVAFCPPFAETPELEVEQAGGPDARIKIAQLQTYGARFEVRLDTSPEEREDLMIEFVAQGPLAE